MAKKKKIAKRRRVLNILTDSLDMLYNGLELTATLPDEDIRWVSEKTNKKLLEITQVMSNTDKMLGFSEKKFYKEIPKPNFDDDLPF